ncbi:copper resistance CopC/CopD family protein [Paenibacillus luteus]|uniref:copper resistance CopC/CopD family protein n=1 Tax=Paenibacillus luteus TaxID=2545753 RepID=UPI001143939B|nr:copper resistance protein CopC [Paenibacillus luteus]
MKKLIQCIAALIMIWACLPSFVSAHAYVAQSTPYQDAELSESPTAIRIKFTEKIDSKLSNVSLQRVDNGSAIKGELSAEGDQTLIYTIPKLSKGIYEVSWQVLSLDTHLTDGTFQFAVGVKMTQTKPDDTVSLDGSNAGSNGDEAGTRPTATSKPMATAKPAATTKPAATKAPSVTAKPSSTPSETPSSASSPNQAPSPAVSNRPDPIPGTSFTEPDASTQPVLTVDTDTTVEPTPEGSAIGNGTSVENPTDTGSQSQEPAADDDGGGVLDESPPTATDDIAAVGAHSGHGGSGSGQSGTDDHEHKGARAGTMIVLRVLDVLAGVFVAGILFFRYVIWKEDADAAPYGFSQAAERMVICGAGIIWLISGLDRLSTLSEQLDGISLYALASGTMIGKVAALRPVLAILILMLAFAPVRERAWANPFKFAVAAAVIVSFPLTGHAYASLNDTALAITAHSVHMGAAAIWFGGLAGLLSLTFHSGGLDRLNQTAARFSVWALPSMVLILASGVWLSVARLSGWRQLIETDYGRLIFAKIIFMLLVLVIAALHKLVFMPRIAEKGASRGLLLGVRAEVLLAVVLFVLAGWLSSTSPPEAAAETKLTEPIYWHVMGEKAHMSLRISEDGKSEQQAARLDVWLPEEMGAPVSVEAALQLGDENSEAGERHISIPLQLDPPALEKFEYPGFKKYTYRGIGDFVEDRRQGMLLVDIKDEAGNSFHYERELVSLLLE